MPEVGGFQEVLSRAIDDMLANGFDSVERVQRWLRELRAAADRSMVSPQSVEEELRRGLAATYRRIVDRGGIFKLNPGVDRFTLDRVRPALRAELDRRIMASADLIRLNREQAIETTLRRFSGWSTSIPRGGTSAESRRAVKVEQKKAMGSLPFAERRVLIDQGHKLVSSLNDILATDGGAIAARWRSNWRQPGYDYREDHRERDGKIFLVRGSWAQRAGLVRPGRAGYTDDVTAPAQEPFCRCYYVYLYHLRDLPDDMLTKKGRDALEAARGIEEVRSARYARGDAAVRADDAGPMRTKTEVHYVGAFAPRPQGRRCDGCTMFLGGARCDTVMGAIDPGGYCEIHDPELAPALTARRGDAALGVGNQNTGIAHAGRSAGSDPICGTRNVYMVYAREQFATLPTAMQCKKCAAQLEEWARRKAEPVAALPSGVELPPRDQLRTLSRNELIALGQGLGVPTEQLYTGSGRPRDHHAVLNAVKRATRGHA